ncbi:MAG: helix-hairpin-helix domain-containing protein [Chloroflexota bacterium]|nr:helix-hairpin-helix domain-containing protein [Chloroflexota bacterium]MDQ5864463.1 helix-hairpin-helix domain-containing protein [Chloroflexota bacterium]
MSNNIDKGNNSSASSHGRDDEEGTSFPPNVPPTASMSVDRRKAALSRAERILFANGFTSREKLLEASREELLAVPGMGEKLLDHILEEAHTMSRDEWEQAVYNMTWDKSGVGAPRTQPPLEPLGNFSGLDRDIFNTYLDHIKRRSGAQRRGRYATFDALAADYRLVVDRVRERARTLERKMEHLRKVYQAGELQEPGQRALVEEYADEYAG